jgi:hypothetical protein
LCVYFTELPKEVQERFHYDPANAAQFTAQNAAETKQVQINEKLGEIALEIDKQKLYVREGRILQVMDDGIVLSRSPTWYADGRPAQWIGPIFVRGSFPAATDGTAMEGWIWPAGTYKIGARTLEAWANSRDIAVKAQVREAAQTSENRQE